MKNGLSMEDKQTGIKLVLESNETLWNASWRYSDWVMRWPPPSIQSAGIQTQKEQDPILEALDFKDHVY